MSSAESDAVVCECASHEQAVFQAEKDPSNVVPAQTQQLLVPLHGLP